MKGQYDEKLAQKEELRRKSEDMELKLDRAGKLVTGLAGERVRWEETVVVCSNTHSHSDVLCVDVKIQPEVSDVIVCV